MIPEAPQAEFEDGGIRANTLSVGQDFQLTPLASASMNPVGVAYEPTSTFLSEVMEADFGFDAVGVEWRGSNPEGTDLNMEIRFRTTNNEWTDWQQVDSDIDGEGGDQLIPTTRSDALQYKIRMASNDGKHTPRIRNLEFHYIDASSETSSNKKGISKIEKEMTPAVLQKSLFGTQSPQVIPRSQWGADEEFGLNRYFGVKDSEPNDEIVEDQDLQDNEEKNGEKSMRELYPEEFELTKTIKKNEEGESLYWPQEYAKNTEKIIVHHTASTKNLNNPEAAIRAIYYYHSVRRGWGDIGYNYIIDTAGNIYEGRAGGEGVVAGHAQGYNTGSLGIAVLGNYENDQVAFPVLNALATLIQEKSDLYNIRADGFSRFRGEVSANVMGHRDAGHTLCPGENLYAALPALRTLVGNNRLGMEDRLGTQMTNKDYEFVSTSNYGAVLLDPEATSKITLKVKNIGTKTWNNKTYLVADQNENAERMVHLTREAGNPVSLGRMEEKSVAPGKTATFKVSVEAKLRGGFENYRITPIFNGTKKTRHYLDLPIYVAAPTLSYELVTLNIQPTRIKAGQEVTGTLKLRNTGNIAWHRTGEYPMEIQSSSGARFASLKESSVAPGATGTFQLKWRPSGAGAVKARLIPTLKNLDKLKGASISASLTIYDQTVGAKLVSMSSGVTFKPGERKALTLELKNTGGATWDKNGRNGLNIGKTNHPSIKVTKPILTVPRLSAGKTGKVRFSVKAPEKPGDYTIYFRPRLGAKNLMQDPIKFEFSVSGTASPVVATPAATSSAPTSVRVPISTPVYTSTIASELDQEFIRIKLGFDAAQFGNPEITANGAFKVLVDGDPFLTLSAGDEVEVRRTNDRYQILHDARAWVVNEFPQFVPVNDSTIMKINNYEHRPAWNPSLNDNRFRGNLEVQEVNGNLTIINELTMDSYLRGIGEVENGAPTEKIRTMMILARTYARYYLTEDEKFPGLPYDLSDNPDESQKYLGYGFEERAPNIARAVRDTRGKVVTYQGNLVKTPYFSRSDGITTKSAQEVWGWTHTPYLISVADPLCESTRFSGHGVGLSGCGATAAAQAGKSYEQIIKYYYTGVEIAVK